jgi:hypothetical protein
LLPLPTEFNGAAEISDAGLSVSGIGLFAKVQILPSQPTTKMNVPIDAVR